MTQKTKKHSAAKKLVPAAGMLAVSAMMLATSTYAWFTMAREVEVTNIQMTASVPEDLQISLGMLGGITNGENESHGLADNYGFLVNAANGNTADNGGVAAPGDDAIYWSNTADISAYYALGKIMPASSTDGKNVYFTPDASGVGKTIKSGAKYYKAVEGSAVSDDANGHSNMTTLHALAKTNNEVANNDTWKGTGTTSYKAASGWDDTNDDGYFVDIPVWLRSSSYGAANDTIPLSVDAYVTTKNKQDDDDLYLAARAVILNDARSDSSGLIEIKKDSYGTAEEPGDSIVDFMASTNSTGAAVASVDASNKATYGAETHYDGTIGKSQVAVPKSTVEGKYGTPTKIWIRVWLEGEDPNCWNENAGQDFNISLKFSREDVKLPTTHPFSASASANETSTLTVGTQTQVTFPGNITNTYTYNGASWTNSSTFPAPALGQYYKAGSVSIFTEADLAAYIKTNITNSTLAASGLTLTAENIAPDTQGAVLPKQLTITDGAWSASPDISATGFYVQETGESFTTAAAALDACGNTGTYHVTVTYLPGVSSYAVAYSNPTVAGTTATGDAATLKLMQIIICDNEASPSYTYKWFVAPDNAYKLPTGAKLTSSLTGENQYDLDTLITAINATNNNGTISTITEVSAPVETVYPISIQNAPNGQSVTLIKTIDKGTITWAEKATEDGVYTQLAAPNSGSKLNYVGSGNDSGYDSVADLCVALNTAQKDSAPQIVWQYNYVGTFTAEKPAGSDHYTFTSNDATFPIDFTAYNFKIGTGAPTTYANLAALEAAIDAAIGANSSITVTTFAAS